MGEFLAGQPELVMEAMITYGALQESGQVLHFDVLERLSMRRPDKLSWLVLNGDGTTDQAWLSGGRFTLITQPANMWGTVSVPSTIPAAMDRLAEEYSLDIPFHDLLATDPAERWLGDGETSIEYVAEEWVQGSWTDHISIRKPAIDFEIWVRQGPEPFPAKMTIVFLAEEGLPTYVARFRSWSTTLPRGDATFEFIAPTDAQQVEVAPVIWP